MNFVRSSVAAIWPWSGNQSQIAYLVKVSEEGELVLQWNEISESLKKIHNNPSQGCGFISVIGQPGSGKTTIMNKFMESSKLPSGVNFPTAMPPGDPEGILIRFKPIIKDDTELVALFCLDIVSHGKNSDVYTKLVRFCTQVSSSLIVMYGGYSEVWNNPNLHAMFVSDVNKSSRRNTCIVHVTVISHKDGTVRILPAWKCKDWSWLKKKAPQHYVESMTAFMKNVSQVSEVCHSFVPSDVKNPPKETKDGFSLFETILFKVPPILINTNSKLRQDNLGLFLSEKCSSINGANEKKHVGAVALVRSTLSLSDNVTQQVRQSIAHLLKDSSLSLSSKPVYGMTKADCSSISKDEIQKFLGHIQSFLSIQEVNSKDVTKLTDAVEVHPLQTTTRPTSYASTELFSGYDSSCTPDSSIIFQQAVTEYLLQFSLSLLQGHALDDAIPKTTLNQIVTTVDLSRKLCINERIKKDLDAKWCLFQQDFLRTHSQLKDCEAQLNEIIAKRVCLDSEFVQGIKLTWVDGAASTVHISSFEAKPALLSVLQSASVLLFSRFNSINTANMGYEIIIVDHALQYSLSAYVTHMNDCLQSSYFSKDKFQLMHDLLVKTLRESFQPNEAVFPTSFLWEAKVLELDKKLTKLFDDYAKMNTQNCAVFEKKYRNVLTEAVAVYESEINRPGPENIVAKQVVAKNYAFETLQRICIEENENDVILFRAALNEAIANIEIGSDPKSSLHVAHRKASHSSTFDDDITENQGHQSVTRVTRSMMTNTTSPSFNNNHDPLLHPSSTHLQTENAITLVRTQSNHNEATSTSLELPGTICAELESNLVKTEIVSLIQELRRKLETSPNMSDYMRQYIEKQVEEANCLLQNSSATSFQLSKIKYKLEMSLDEDY